MPGVTLFSLQQDNSTGELSALGERFGIVDFGDELDQSHGAFMDTAAIMKNLDLVVVSDSSLGHLAGALNVPVWAARSYAPEWRWLTEREDSPWYPSMRLFRQTVVNQWSDFLERIAHELTILLATRRGSI